MSFVQVNFIVCDLFIVFNHVLLYLFMFMSPETVSLKTVILPNFAPEFCSLQNFLQYDLRDIASQFCIGRHYESRHEILKA